jgi:hypothetical protein
MHGKKNLKLLLLLLLLLLLMMMMIFWGQPLTSNDNVNYKIEMRTYVEFCDTHLLTPRSRVLLEKLTGFAASQEIPRIYGTRKFINVLTSARHQSLS